MQDNPAQLVFEQWDRGHHGATQLVFVNNGGRSRLILTRSATGTVKALAPVLHKQIAKDTITAAHAYAKTVHGARKNWPVHIAIDRPTS